MSAPLSPVPENSAENENLDVNPHQPWRRYLVPILIGVVVTSIVMVVFYTRMRGIAPVASGSVQRLTMYPMHTAADAASQGPGMPGAPADQDQVILFAQVQVKNLSKQPLELFDFSALLKSSQEPQKSRGASPVDIDRLFQAFPDLAALRAPLLMRRQVIAPGQSASGLVIFNYPITQQEWNQRSGLQITVSFENGPSLVLDAH